MANQNTNYEEDYKNLMNEYLEFKSEAKEYEEALELELAEKDEKIVEISEKFEKLQGEYQALRKKYENDESEIVHLHDEIEKLRKKVKSFEDQKRELEDLNDQWEKSARILEYSKQALEERLNQAEEMAILYKEEMEELSVTKEIEVQRLKDQYNELKQELTIFSVEKSENSKKTKAEIVTLHEGISIPPKTLSRTPSKPNSRGHSRKNSVDSADGSQSVKVLIRVRPPLKEEIWDKNFFNIGQNAISIREAKGKALTEPKIFEFEKILGPDQNEEKLFADVKESVDQIFQGKNACVMAYGQTGSGKTYTMNSIVTRSIELLKTLENVQVSIQCIEVYNESVRNLLQNDLNAKNGRDMLENFEVKLESEWADQALEIIKSATSKRTTKATECNDMSSRSHAIYTLNFLFLDFSAKIQFVDLAGSERVGKSNVSGETLKEALSINKSLSALQDVISALESKSKHVPYRNSTLTKILQPTLGGKQSLVTMIINCNPSQDSLNESLCTLALASRVKAVDLGFFIRKNLKNKEVERTLNLLEKERLEKNSLLRTLDKVQRDLESYQFAVKDKDNKIAMLNNKIKLRDKAYQEIRVKPKIEVMKAEPAKKKIKKGALTSDDLVKSKNKNLIHLSIKDIGRVVSFSPPLKMPVSPNFLDKPSRIPTPSCVNLKFGNSV